MKSNQGLFSISLYFLFNPEHQNRIVYGGGGNWPGLVGWPSATQLTCLNPKTVDWTQKVARVVSQPEEELPCWRPLGQEQWGVTGQPQVYHLYNEENNASFAGSS